MGRGGGGMNLSKYSKNYLSWWPQCEVGGVKWGRAIKRRFAHQPRWNGWDGQPTINLPKHHSEPSNKSFFCPLPFEKTGVTFFPPGLAWDQFHPTTWQALQCFCSHGDRDTSLASSETSHHPTTLASPSIQTNQRTSFDPSIDHPPVCEPPRSTTTGLKFHSVCLRSLQRDGENKNKHHSDCFFHQATVRAECRQGVHPCTQKAPYLQLIVQFLFKF